ncbi:hypothetical protein MXB_3158, partial [Myxobolus squamalis]
YIIHFQRLFKNHTAKKRAPQIFVKGAYNMSYTAQCFVYGCSGGLIIKTPRFVHLVFYNILKIELEFSQNSLVFNNKKIADWQENYLIKEKTIQSSLFDPDVIFKVESYSIIRIPNENISQLHRIALAIKGHENTFLCIENDEIKKREIMRESNNEIELPESACWSLVATGNVETIYIEPINYTSSITPVPKVTKIEENNLSTRILEVYGTGFTPDMMIFIGDYDLRTTFRY